MKIRLGLISWATGTLMLAAVAACGGSDTDPPATAEPSSTASSSQTRLPQMMGTHGPENGL